MGFTRDFLTALGEHLDGHGVAWDPAEAYAAQDVGLYVDALPTQPDRAVAMNLYPVTDDTGTTDATVAVQFRARGRRRNRADVKDIVDALYDRLDSATNYHLGATPVVRSWRQSGADLGTDASHRQESTQNYYFQITRQSPHRRD